MKLAISDPGRFALKNAVRAAIVVPIAFWLGLKFFEQPQMALFGAFGSVGMLVFVDFGGTRAVRPPFDWVVSSAIESRSMFAR